MNMFSMRKLERILDALAGVNYMEWTMIADKINQQFERKRNRMELMMEDTARIQQAMQIEYGSIIPQEEPR